MHCKKSLLLKAMMFKLLCLGGYTRLPRCIKERIIPPPPISALEKRLTLLKLNQVIEYRLVNSAVPLQMRNLKVRIHSSIWNNFLCLCEKMTNFRLASVSILFDTFYSCTV